MFFQLKAVFSLFAKHAETPEQRLDWAKDQIRSVDTGRALLRTAEDMGIDIVPRELEAELGKLQWKRGLLSINAGLKKETMVFILAHELFHVQQYNNGLFDGEPSASQRDAILLTRLAEGDANARAGLLVKQINAARGLSLPYPYHSISGLGLRGVFNRICGRTSPNDYVLNRLFKNFQKSSSSRLYDRFISKWAKEEWDLPNPVPLLQSSRRGIEKTVRAGGKADFGYLNAQTPEDMFQKLGVYARRALRKLT